MTQNGMEKGEIHHCNVTEWAKICSILGGA